VAIFILALVFKTKLIQFDSSGYFDISCHSLFSRFEVCWGKKKERERNRQKERERGRETTCANIMTPRIAVTHLHE